MQNTVVSQHVCLPVFRSRGIACRSLRPQPVTARRNSSDCHHQHRTNRNGLSWKQLPQARKPFSIPASARPTTLAADYTFKALRPHIPLPPPPPLSRWCALKCFAVSRGARPIRYQASSTSALGEWVIETAAAPTAPFSRSLVQLVCLLVSWVVLVRLRFPYWPMGRQTLAGYGQDLPPVCSFLLPLGRHESCLLQSMVPSQPTWNLKDVGSISPVIVSDHIAFYALPVSSTLTW